MIIILSITSVVCLVIALYLGSRAYILAGILADQEDYYDKVSQTNQYMYMRIKQSLEEMQNIDRLGAFEKDDESGTTFTLLKQVIEELKEEFDAEEKNEK
tara:strand:- start:146 stop:445 length:300 start_codon:yes stop_codon:yes gene_type:complete